MGTAAGDPLDGPVKVLRSRRLAAAAFGHSSSPAPTAGGAVAEPGGRRRRRSEESDGGSPDADNSLADDGPADAQLGSRRVRRRGDAFEAAVELKHEPADLGCENRGCLCGCC